MDYINDSVIGCQSNSNLNTVFGVKPNMYLDYTASARSLTFIEDYIRNSVLPIYANTHSMQSASGKQTVLARHEARMAIK